MHYQYYFCDRYKVKLVEFLKENNIKYSPNNAISEGDFISFSVYSNSKSFNEIISTLQQMKVRSPLVFAEYTKLEIDSAQLLVISPKRHCVDIINAETAYEKSCKWQSVNGIIKVNHKRQKDFFVIKKELPMKNSTAFSTEDTGKTELFADSRVLKLVQDNLLSGFDFEKVLTKQGTFCDNTYHLKSTNIITKECICKGKGEKIEFCQFCQKEQLIINNIYQLYLKGSLSDYTEDMYMTECVFGPGVDYPLYIISQSFYRLLKAHKLAGGLTISPVMLVMT